MSKIVVTGGVGFIGTHLVKVLQEEGHEVEIIDIASDVPRDVRNLEEIKPVFKGAEYVFHLAAIASVPYSIEYPREAHDTNLTGTLNVILASRDAGVKRMVFPSSAAVYGDQELLPVSESATLKPKSPYALQKLESEMYLRLASDIYDIETVSLRYFNVYGPDQKSDGPYASVIPIFLKLKKEGKPLVIYGDGNQTRDFVHVSDVVRANILAMKSRSVGKGESINIASGKSVSVNDIADIVGGPREYHSERLEVRNSLANISSAKELLKWEPEVSIEDGIKELL